MSNNPLFVPEPAVKRPACPKCGGDDFSGRRVQGVVTFTCKNPECNNKWYGGLPQEPQDPRVPVPPPKYTPPLEFERSNSNTEGVAEVRRRVSLTPSFRKGAPIPQGDE